MIFSPFRPEGALCDWGCELAAQIMDVGGVLPHWIKGLQQGLAGKWFYIGNHPPALPVRTRRSSLPSAESMADVSELKGLIEGLKNTGLPTSDVAHCEYVRTPDVAHQGHGASRL